MNEDTLYAAVIALAALSLAALCVTMLVVVVARALGAPV